MQNIVISVPENLIGKRLVQTKHNDYVSYVSMWSISTVLK